MRPSEGGVGWTRGECQPACRWLLGWSSCGQIQVGTADTSLEYFLLSSIDQLCFISKQCQSQSFTGGEEELPVRGMTENGRFCVWTISGCDEYETGGLKNPYVLLNRRLMINTILPRMPFCSSNSSLLLILQQQLPLRLVFHSVPCSFPLLLVVGPSIAAWLFSV